MKQIDFLIVTSTPVESRTVVNVFQESTGKENVPELIGDRIYLNLGEINGNRIYMCQSGMGTGGVDGSQENIGIAIRMLSPSAVIMVGIAFGVNESKQKIGDILVSERLMLYDLRRIGTDDKGNQEIILRGDRPHASPRLINLFRTANISWNESNGRVRFGLILSGDKLVDNFDYREQLQKFEREAIGGEMEGGGLYTVCHNGKVDWIVIKSICDWADGSKSENNEDDRQKIAATNAATFVLHGLEKNPTLEKREYKPVFDKEIDEVISVNQIKEARKRLNQYLDDSQLVTFILNNFPMIYDRLGRGMGKDEKLNILLDHCRRNPADYHHLESILDDIKI